jgi:hypothetical protein
MLLASLIISKMLIAKEIEWAWSPGLHGSVLDF